MHPVQIASPPHSSLNPSALNPRPETLKSDPKPVTGNGKRKTGNGRSSGASVLMDAVRTANMAQEVGEVRGQRSEAQQREMEAKMMRSLNPKPLSQDAEVPKP
jgi:hypothetical protein